MGYRPRWFVPVGLFSVMALLSTSQSTEAAKVKNLRRDTGTQLVRRTTVVPAVTAPVQQATLNNRGSTTPAAQPATAPATQAAATVLTKRASGDLRRLATRRNARGLVAAVERLETSLVGVDVEQRPATGVAGEPCNADTTGDGQLSELDVFGFLDRYFAGDIRADMNSTGTVTVQDLFDYVADYLAGCTPGAQTGVPEITNTDSPAVTPAQ